MRKRSVGAATAASLLAFEALTGCGGNGATAEPLATCDALHLKVIGKTSLEATVTFTEYPARARIVSLIFDFGADNLVSLSFAEPGTKLQPDVHPALKAGKNTVAVHYTYPHSTFNTDVTAQFVLQETGQSGRSIPAPDPNCSVPSPLNTPTH